MTDESTAIDGTEEAAKTDASDEEGRQQDSLGELVRILIYSIIIATGIRVVVFEPFNIPSESMLPTLMVGDYLVVSKYPYGYSRHSLPFSLNLFDGRILESQVRRGDVVVFKRPLDKRTDYIKRIMGLPGDRIQMKGGQLFLNGKAVRRERVKDFVVQVSPNTRCKNGTQFQFTQADGSVVCRYPQYRETLPSGVRYMTLDLYENGPSDNTRVFVVPQGHYFAMGDNRDNSADSRRSITEGVGFVPAENLVGRAEILFFSTDGSASWWQPWYWYQASRGERFFDSLRPDE